MARVVHDSRAAGGWLVFIQGESSGIEAWRVKAKELSNSLPDIRANEVYDIGVISKPSLRERLAALVAKKLLAQRVDRIKARVITQSAIAEDSLVYLKDVRGRALYGVSSRALQRRTREGQFIPSSPVSVRPDRQGTLQYISEQKRAQGCTQEPLEVAFGSPEDIAALLAENVLNQGPAVRRLAVAAYDHLRRPAGVKKSNVLIVGSTGTGKTELARTMAEILGVPFSEAKVSAHSSTGYRGTNLATVFEGLHAYRKSEALGRAVLFLDEMDKLTERVSDISGFGPILQNEIIGWAESATVKVPLDVHAYFEVDTTNMLFVGAGAFVGLEAIIAKRLGATGTAIGFADSRKTRDDRAKTAEELYEQMIPDDIIRFGFKPELVGRFPVLTFTRRLGKTDLITIMQRGTKSVFNQQLRLLREGYGIGVTVDEAVYGIAADAALALGTGARGIETVSSRLFEGIKYDIRRLTQGGTSLLVTPEMAFERLKTLLPEGYKI